MSRHQIILCYTVSQYRKNRDGRNKPAMTKLEAPASLRFSRRSAPPRAAFDRQTKISALPQGIVLRQKTTLYAVDGSWIGTPSLIKAKFLDARSTQQSREHKVSFAASRLVLNTVV